MKIALLPGDDAQAVHGSAVPVLFAPGAIKWVGREASKLGSRTLLVSDAGIQRAGHVERAAEYLRNAGLHVSVFAGAGENPTTEHVAAGLEVARSGGVDLIIGLGGGSSMDCAKAVNFLYTNGGQMRDYRGVGKASRPMLPFIAIPTTTGTGSEAQSAALIVDPETHQKMACLDKRTLARLAILDEELTVTQPRRVAALAGIDAVSHAIETAGCLKRTETSRAASRAAWELVKSAYLAMVKGTSNTHARRDMLVGAHLAGVAIENSMLGAAHACANPLTARFGTPHGAAVGLMLPSVIRFNAAKENPYADLHADAHALAREVEEMLEAAGLPQSLQELAVPASDLSDLARLAAVQWTVRFNPRPVSEADLLHIYETAYVRESHQ